MKHFSLACSALALYYSWLAGRSNTTTVKVKVGDIRKTIKAVRIGGGRVL